MGGDDDLDFNFVRNVEQKLPLLASGLHPFPFEATGRRSQTCGLIDFTAIQVVPGIAPNSYFLIVIGTAPTPSLKVSLKPLYYVTQPNYWEIEVVGSLDAVILEKESEFVVTLDVTNLMGSQGLTVVGATVKQSWDLK